MNCMKINLSRIPYPVFIVKTMVNYGEPWMIFNSYPIFFFQMPVDLSRYLLWTRQTIQLLQQEYYKISDRNYILYVY